jgi:acyl carrier protein
MVKPPPIDAAVRAAIERAVGRAVEPGDELVRDLGLDSLTLTSLAVELEDAFRVRLDGAQPRTVADVTRLIERRLAESS